MPCVNLLFATRSSCNIDLDRITSRMSYDNTGNIYDVNRVLTPEMTLDVEKYKAYSPLYLPSVLTFSREVPGPMLTHPLGRLLLCLMA